MFPSDHPPSMTVLVPIDGSEPSMNALEYACAEHADATLTVLYVSNVTTGQNRFIAGGSFGEWKETEQRRATELFEEARSRADEAGAEIDVVHEFGDPLRLIVSYAEEHGVDAVVIGSHGRDGVSRLALGSVAERVVRLAPMPVVVVK